MIKHQLKKLMIINAEPSKQSFVDIGKWSSRTDSTTLHEAGIYSFNEHKRTGYYLEIRILDISNNSNN